MISNSRHSKTKTIPFYRNGNRPNTAYRTGDRVLIVKSKYDFAPFSMSRADDAWTRISTRGSIGTIVSFEEYREFILVVNRTLFPAVEDYFHSHLAAISEEISLGKTYPVRYEKIARSEAGAAAATGEEARLWVGWIQLLEPEYLQLIPG